MNDQLLSEREKEILYLVTTGISNKEISQKLHLSVNTVKVHLRNIFAKLEVTSRTEAAMWAVQNGYFETGENNRNDQNGVISDSTDNNLQNDLNKSTKRSFGFFSVAGNLRYFVLFGGLILALLIGWGIIKSISSLNASTVPDVNPIEVEESRWNHLTDMPTARVGFAAVAYDNKLYAIGGENTEGVLDVNESYDPENDSWKLLSSKPVAVSDVHAGVIGGKLYIPGGRMNNDQVTDILEIYDPRTDQWSLGPKMPNPMSAYALATFEGRLYLFGGWDSQKILNKVLMFDPSQDIWTDRTSLQSPKGIVGASVIGDKIFLIGGSEGNDESNKLDEFFPALDLINGDPWNFLTLLPKSISGLSTASIAGNVYITGYDGEKQIFQTYLPQQDQWHFYEILPPYSQKTPSSRLVSLNSQLYFLGGRQGDVYFEQLISFQATYTVVFPVLNPDS